MDVVVALSARAAQGGIHLRHSRILIRRHHARRGDADHRHGGDERFPPGAAVKNSRPERPSVDPAAGIAAHRLCGCVGAGVESRRHLSRRAFGRGAGAGLFALQCVRRGGARHARRRSAKLTQVAKNIKQGTLDGFDDNQGIAIGSRLAEQLSVRAGDNLTLVAPRGAVTPMGTTPRIKAYKVTGVFEIGMSEYDAAFVFMPLTEAQAYFNRTGDVTAIEVYTDDPDHIERFRKLVNDAAARPIYMVDWRQRNATFFGALQVERNVMFLILTLIVLVAALNIVSGLIMLVKDKGSDIAILRTMGATQGAIMRVFLITGAAIGFVGTVVGFLLGTVVCLNIEAIRRFLSWLTNTNLFPPELYFLSKLPADMNASETTAVVVMALGLSLLATLYPSWRAARLDPVEALRYE